MLSPPGGGVSAGRDHLQRHGWPEAARREVRGRAEGRGDQTVSTGI